MSWSQVAVMTVLALAVAVLSAHEQRRDHIRGRYFLYVALITAAAFVGCSFIR